ncbi:MAG: hypothetical protein WCJ64_07670 [Rhodospirillaceae bacterium]
MKWEEIFGYKVLEGPEETIKSANRTIANARRQKTQAEIRKLDDRKADKVKSLAGINRPGTIKPKQPIKPRKPQ